MASLNKVQLIGNLGRDPEMRHMPSGDALTTIAIATTESWKDKATGEKKESTEWHKVVFMGKLAELANQYLKKGSQVYIEGSLRTRKFIDKDGVEKYSTEIRADNMLMFGGRQNDGQAAPAPAQRSAAPQQPRYQAPATGAHNFDDDIPFSPVAKKAWGAL